MNKNGLLIAAVFLYCLNYQLPGKHNNPTVLQPPGAPYVNVWVDLVRVTLFCLYLVSLKW